MKKWFIILFVSSSLVTFAGRYTELELFAYVLNTIQSEYIKPIKMNKLVHGAIQGLLRELDPHSQFFTPKKFKLFENAKNGIFQGIGIELERRKGFLIVISVFPQSPAEKAGFKEGDKIVSLNKESVKDMTLEEFFQTINKRKISKYQVMVLRGDKSISLKVRPSVVKIQSVKFKKITKDIMYIRVFQFEKNTHYRIKKNLKSKLIKGVILDLRSNPGGMLESAVYTSDLFLSKGKITSLKARNKDDNETFYAKSSTSLPLFSIVVLINEYSASASEIVAAALKENKRAVIMGRKSFGKGSVQNIFHLPRNYALKLTIGEYRTPLGASINGKGIVPNRVLDEPQVPVNFSLNNTDKDTDIQTALKHLQGAIGNDI